MQTTSTMSARNWFLLFFLSLLWGGSFFFIKIAVTELPVFTIVFLRVLIGGMVLFPVAMARGGAKALNLKVWLSFILMGLLNNVIPFSLIATAQKSIDSGFASILNGTTPFFTVLVAHFLTKDEKISLRKIAGILMGVAGVSVLIGFDVFRSGSNRLSGIIAILTATLSYAFAGVWGRRFKTYGVDPILTASGQLLGSTVILLPVVMAVDAPWKLPFPHMPVIVAVLGLAFFSSALAYIIYFSILSSSGATNVLLVTLLIPVSALLLGIAVLSEQFHMNYLWGMLFIALGLMAIDGRILKYLTRRRDV